MSTVAVIFFALVVGFFAGRQYAYRQVLAELLKPEVAPIFKGEFPCKGNFYLHCTGPENH